jgi:hypothetical protein
MCEKLSVKLALLSVEEHPKRNTSMQNIRGRSMPRKSKACKKATLRTRRAGRMNKVSTRSR